ncbi:hypothetical protein PS9374_02799 [Planomonospora sphaerica]|uniref:Uncharacterized protein n=1 Tax=Planomonospora sphaerica TaxID=161355 RepID=A0A171CSG4_9ACTN|nr:DUF6052 family protein [Planomonospora sphaerica]GAT67146.1 hypothetical protein PS9374_02799 [Planomonospora sphaerica]
MNVRSESSGAGLSAAQERQLLECHAVLGRLEESCEVPAVRAAVRTALAELRAALDSQAVDFPFFPLPEEADGLRPGPDGANGADDIDRADGAPRVAEHAGAA